jgi:hypothetical protein
MKTALLVMGFILLAGCSAAPEPVVGAKSEEIGRTAIGFSQCMRDRGHELPDPSFNEDGLPIFNEPERQNEENPAYESDRRECRTPLNDAMVAAGVPNQKGTPDQWLAFARCMRQNGVDMPDPTADNRFTIDGALYDSPAWEPAAQACGEQLPPGMRAILQKPGPKGGLGK